MYPSATSANLFLRIVMAASILILAACATSLGSPPASERAASCRSDEIRVCRGGPLSKPGEVGEEDFDMCICQPNDRIRF